MILSPNDNPLKSSSNDIKDQKFGGNREFTTGTQQKKQDYTKSAGVSPNIKENPVEETTRDIDSMSDPKARKREFSRRAETADPADHNKEHFHESDPENRPLEDTNEVLTPDNKFHGNKLKYHFGNGQYEGEIS